MTKKINFLEATCAVRTGVDSLMKKFADEFQHEFKYYWDGEMTVRFDKKGTVAGISNFNYVNGKGYLNFNKQLMMDNWSDFEQTVIHEVAHYCVSLMYGSIYSKGGRRVIHGKQWKSVMEFFGASDDRCHDYDVSKVKTRVQRRWSYKCSCQTFELSTTRHNKIVRKGVRYSCPKCNTRLEKC